jgi:hypothetical protein
LLSSLELLKLKSGNPQVVSKLEIKSAALDALALDQLKPKKTNSGAQAKLDVPPVLY